MEPLSSLRTNKYRIHYTVNDTIGQPQALTHILDAANKWAAVAHFCRRNYHKEHLTIIKVEVEVTTWHEV